MSEELILRYCAPTLAGLKTGSLFSYRFESLSALKRSVRRWNTRLAQKGVWMLPLRYADRRALIYLYRPCLLSRDLQEPEVYRILKNMGYRPQSSAACLRRLAKRLDRSGDFPHEVGLFLGYPAQDVLGFIKNSAGACKYAGYWKVYGNVDEAKALFEKYRKCTQIYLTQWLLGISVEQLVVCV